MHAKTNGNNRNMSIIKHVDMQSTILSDTFLYILHSHSPGLQTLNRLETVCAKGLRNFRCMLAEASTLPLKRNEFLIK